MLSTILVYVSLFLQVAAAVIAISLFKRTKFNASWILISVGFLLMVVSRVFDLWPTIYPEMEDELAIVQKILAFIIALVLLIGVFYIRKIFQFMRRVDEIRRESEKRVLAAVIRTEEQERQRFAKELHDGLGPLLSVIKMLVSGLDANKESEVNEKIKQNLRQAVDEASCICFLPITTLSSPARSFFTATSTKPFCLMIADTSAPCSQPISYISQPPGLR